MDLSSYKWTCTCCGKQMVGLPVALAFDAPHNWHFLDDATRSNSKISDDFCLIESKDGDDERYIRCYLDMPLLLDDGTSGQFQFGVWVSVSKKCWHLYWEGFETGVYAEEGCFGYLSNRIASYPDSLNLHADVQFRSGALRPLVILHNGDHELIRDQEVGMEVSKLVSLLAKQQH